MLLGEGDRDSGRDRGVDFFDVEIGAEGNPQQFGDPREHIGLGNEAGFDEDFGQRKVFLGLLRARYFEACLGEIGSRKENRAEVELRCRACRRGHFSVPGSRTWIDESSS